MIKRYFFASISLLLILSAIVFYILSLNIEKSKHLELADMVRSYFEKRLHAQESNALTLAILLAQNDALKKALIELNEERGHEILFKSLSFLKKYTLSHDIRAQVITKDLTIFARSWDKEFAGMPLEGFRKDLSSFKITKPKVSVEAGRLLTIKATTPIRNGYKIIGYMETIAFFDTLTKSLRDDGIELIVLMEQKYLDVATLMRENPMISHYVISNRNYNHFLYERLKNEDLKPLFHDGIFYDGEYLFLTKTMINSKKENLGLYILALSERKVQELERLKENISFFLTFNKDEFSKIASIWRDPKGSFRSLYDKSVLEFLSKSESAKDFEPEAREILQNYRKEELIDIILSKYRREEKRGEIE